MIVVQVPGREPAVFTGEFTAGRAGCELLLDSDIYVSNRHARFTPLPDHWVVEDLGSTNGSYLNGYRFYGPARLRKGDKVRIGRTVIVVVPS